MSLVLLDLQLPQVCVLDLARTRAWSLSRHHFSNRYTARESAMGIA